MARLQGPLDEATTWRHASLDAAILTEQIHAHFLRPRTKPMTGLSGILPWIPLLVPLFAAGLVGLAPKRWLAAPRRHWVYLGALLLGVVAALFAHLGIAKAAPASTGDLAAFERTGRLAWDNLALFFALLFSGIHVAVGVASQGSAGNRPKTAAILLLATASFGVFAAADLYTLCLMWGLSDLALLWLRAGEAPEGHGRRTAWNTWGGLASTVLLVTAALLVPESEGHSVWQAATTAEAPAAFLMLAVIMRIGVPPLSGHLLQHWETFLGSLWMGASVWLRLVADPVILPAGGYLAPVGAGMMLAAGLLTVLAPSTATALPYAALQSLTIAVLAPLIAPQEGAAVALLAALNVTLIVALLAINDRIDPFPPLGRWTRIPEGIALASWMGMPLALGFLVHWAFLRICWLASLQSLVFCGSISFLLAAAPAWRRLLALFGSDETPLAEAHWSRWAGAGSAIALALALLVTGVAPGALSWVGVGAAGALGVERLLGSEADLVGSLVYLAFLGPLIGGLSLQHLLRDLPEAATRWLERARGVLLLDWLVLLLEEVLTRWQLQVDRILSAIEGGFYLGWSLIWSLMIMLFLFDGRI